MCQTIIKYFELISKLRLNKCFQLILMRNQVFRNTIKSIQNFKLRNLEIIKNFNLNNLRTKSLIRDRRANEGPNEGSTLSGYCSR